MNTSDEPAGIAAFDAFMRIFGMSRVQPDETATGHDNRGTEEMASQHCDGQAQWTPGPCCDRVKDQPVDCCNVGRAGEMDAGMGKESQLAAATRRWLNKDYWRDMEGRTEKKFWDSNLYHLDSQLLADAWVALQRDEWSCRQYSMNLSDLATCNLTTEDRKSIFGTESLEQKPQGDCNEP